MAGIRFHQGKTRVWNTGGVQPADVALLGPDVWEPQGVIADRLQIRIEGGAAFVGGHTLRERSVWVADIAAIVRTRARTTHSALFHPVCLVSMLLPML